MKIAIISDIHDNVVNLEKCLTWCRAQNIVAIICCGDICDQDTLHFLAANFLGTIYLAWGNGELFTENDLKKYANIISFGRSGGAVKIHHKAIGICHEPMLRKKLVTNHHCDIIFYGHTHLPWEEKFSGIRAINPGTLAGQFTRATFATWDIDDDILALKLIENL